MLNELIKRARGEALKNVYIPESFKKIIKIVKDGQYWKIKIKK